jgi:hypothetical protein
MDAEEELISVQSPVISSQLPVSPALLLLATGNW